MEKTATKKRTVRKTSAAKKIAAKGKRTVRRTATARKSATKGKTTPIMDREIPMWAKYTSLGVASAVIIICFWLFFIQPYSYRWLPCYGTKAYGVCLPHGFSVHGFDVSHHQGKIDWDKLSALQEAPFPVKFVFMKASEGGDFSDTAFEENFRKAREHGFIRGAYHFYNPKRDPASQADFFIRTVKLEPGDLPPVLDIEKRGDNDEQLRKNLRTWLSKIEHHYGVKPILYTSYKFKKRYLSDSIFDSYPYWIAHYYVDSVEYRGEWKFWQHTDIGSLPGISERVDLNVFNGSIDELWDMTIK